MVKLAGEKNADAVRAGRLRLVEGSVEAMPFRDGEFTALSCLVAFFSFPDPARALAEMRRVRDPARGRLAVYTTPPELKGTPAAPYPLATRGRFYEDDELRGLAVDAGLRDPRVERAGGGQLLVARA